MSFILPLDDAEAVFYAILGEFEVKTLVFARF